MTNEEIVKALRICATHKEKGCGLCPQRKYVRCTERLADEAITMIERLTAENAALREKQRWIPVAERMPGPETDVLIVCRYQNGAPFVVQAIYKNGKMLTMNGEWNWIDICDVTHWMPLPEAPEEGEKT